MRKNRLALAILAVALAPAGAFADHSDGGPCAYTNSQQSHTDVGGVAVVYYDTNGGAGTTGTADEAVGVCTKSGPQPVVGQVPNGTLEAGHSATHGWAWGFMDPNHGGYVVLDGNENNTDPLDGYVGVSNYNYCSQTTPTPPPNDGPPDGCAAAADDNTNGGGGFGAFGNEGPTGSPVICGNTTGESWDQTTRNGCYYP